VRGEGETSMSVLVGTAGFKYDDWRGAFYPPALKDQDMLSYYASQFPVLELDYTYYSMPYRRTLETMGKKTPAGFEFCVKAHKSMTHEVTEERAAQQETFDRFFDAMQPLVEQGKFGCLLAQFPWSFKPSEAARDYIARLPELCGGRNAVVEFRNNMWVGQETFDLLQKHGLGFCCVDEPRLRGLMPPVAEATSRTSYVRFHGRNAAKWWKHDVASERYDYLYSKNELDEWLPKIESLVEKTDKVYVLFNNCHEGKAATNARDMRLLLEPVR